ncbi:histidine-specific methyltransferase [Xylariaceae sp. FL1272]|nr:histidine-specific methyltransferase [Xylariaceae sp. FL1272]
MSNISFVHGSIQDIGQENIVDYLKKRIQSSLVNAFFDSKTPYLPEELLYIGKGLDIWGTLVFGPKYYQTHDEIKLFRQNGQEIAGYIKPNCTMVDLGSGVTEKVETLLSTLEHNGQPSVYLALDINRQHLAQDLAILSRKHEKVLCQGVCGTYEDAIAWCARLPSPRAFLWLGSVLLRGSKDEALATLRAWAAIMGPEDIMLVGADGHAGPEHHTKVWNMYHDDAAGWQQLWENGFTVANAVVGESWFDSVDWRLDAVIEGAPVYQHRFRFRACRDVTLGSSGVTFSEGDELGWLDAHKFSKPLVYELCGLAGLEVLKSWSAEKSEMYQYLLARSPREGMNDGHVN